jgi:predicted signal transduction protein with EAL and GGDEF domain
VLQLFADTLSEKLETGNIVGRLGGEEFAAILPGANLATAAVTAEAVRTAFETSAAVIDGVVVAGTVSVGAACHDDIDCDLGALFHRADGALYAAKSAGRNRVELVGPHDKMLLDEASLMDRSDPIMSDAWDASRVETWGSTRRYRRSSAQPSPAPRPRRGGPAFS